MRSHFIPGKITAACAVAGATTLLGGSAPAQSFVAADFATNPTYTNGWSAGQNGGYGFGAWSFDGTTDTNNIADPGTQQTMSNGSAIGRAWTLFNLWSTGGISVVGRAINETNGLQPGQTFETVIQNPTSYNFFRGFDILLGNTTTNQPANDNVAALRMLVFNYFSSNWKTVDSLGTTFVPLSAATTGASGMKFDFTLLTTNTYSYTMTPLGSPSSAYTHTGTLASGNLPINWITYRLWDGASSGPNDTANNFFISSMTIQGVVLNIQVAGTNALLSWPTNIPGFYLEACTNLSPTVTWATNFPAPAVINGQNVVTNPIMNQQEFFRLQQ